MRVLMMMMMMLLLLEREGVSRQEGERQGQRMDGREIK